MCALSVLFVPRCRVESAFGYRFPAAGAYQSDKEGVVVDVPARQDDEDARKWAMAPVDGVRFLHYCDGSWAFVGDDGWPVRPQGTGMDGDEPIETATAPVLDVESTSVTDTEVP